MAIIIQSRPGVAGLGFEPISATAITGAGVLAAASGALDFFKNTVAPSLPGIFNAVSGGSALESTNQFIASQQQLEARRYAARSETTMWIALGVGLVVIGGIIYALKR